MHGRRASVFACHPPRTMLRDAEAGDEVGAADGPLAAVPLLDGVPVTVSPLVSHMAYLVMSGAKMVPVIIGHALASQLVMDRDCLLPLRALFLAVDAAAEGCVTAAAARDAAAASAHHRGHGAEVFAARLPHCAFERIVYFARGASWRAVQCRRAMGRREALVDRRRCAGSASRGRRRRRVSGSALPRACAPPWSLTRGIAWHV